MTVDQERPRIGRRPPDAYLRPHFASKPFRSIRRRDVNALLDEIADERGPVMADRCLATMSRLFSWQQARDDEFVHPIVRGMRRVPQRQMRRSHVLDENEIRAIWTVAEMSGKPELRPYWQACVFAEDKPCA